MRNTRTLVRLVFALGTAAIAPACDGEEMTVGTEPARTPVVEETFQPGEVWSGYVENGPDPVTVTFSTPTEGTLVFGAPPAGPQVVDPDGGPPDYVHLESFAFTLRDAARDGERLRFVIDQHEILKQWCEAQTPYPSPTEASFYLCAPAGLGETERPPGGGCIVQRPEGPVAVNCDKLEFCLGLPSICGCDANGCRIEQNNFIRFDMRIDGRTADGSIAYDGRSTVVQRIYLERQAH